MTKVSVRLTVRLVYSTAFTARASGFLRFLRQPIGLSSSMLALADPQIEAVFTIFAIQILLVLCFLSTCESLFVDSVAIHRRVRPTS